MPSSPRHVEEMVIDSSRSLRMGVESDLMQTFESEEDDDNRIHALLSLLLFCML